MNSYQSARRNFRSQYPTSAKIVELIARGWESTRIAESVQTNVNTVAAVRANLTRGTYHPFVRGNTTNGFKGSCKF